MEIPSGVSVDDRLGLTVILAVQARNSGPYRFQLVPASDTIAGCLAGATATVTIFPKEDLKGADTFDLKAEGLLPNTEFTVFLMKALKASAPYSTSEISRRMPPAEALFASIRSSKKRFPAP